MKQKLIALAIASALSAPAFADSATVYGKLFLTVDSTDAGAIPSASVPTRTRILSNSSRLGFKGSEQLTEDLKAIYQMEANVDAAGSSDKGFGNATRNTGVGLQGGFGKVILGKWDSPYKVVHNKIELFDNDTQWTALQVIGRSEGKNYSTRQKNMVQYWTPSFSGFSGALMYSPDENKSLTPANLNKYIVSTSAKYDLDNLYVSAGYEIRNDQTVAGSQDSAFRAVGKYSLGGAWLGLTYENIQTAKIGKDATGNNFEVVGGYGFGGGHELNASYAKGGNTTGRGVVNNDIDQLSLKYAYKFSKRTETFLAYTVRKPNALPTITVAGGGILHSF